MEKICKNLGWIMECLGVIGSIVLARTYGAVTVDSIYASYTERDWGLTIAIFLGGVLVSSATAFILIGLSEALERIATVEYRMNDVRRELEKLTQDSGESSDTWKCPACGKSNPLYTGTCSCGQERE